MVWKGAQISVGNIPATSWDHKLAFARDPAALYQATCHLWDTWSATAYGAEPVHR